MTENKPTEPTLEELKIKNTVEAINKLLKESNLVLHPILKFTERGIFPSIDLRVVEPKEEVQVEEIKENGEVKS